MASPSLKLGVCNLYSYPLLSQEQVMLWTSNLAGTFTGRMRIKPIKNFGEKGAWAYPGTVQFFSVPPIISRTAKATDFKCGGYIYRANPNKSPLTFLEKMERGRMPVSRDCPCVGLPPIIPGTGKAMDFKFGVYIYRTNLNQGHRWRHVTPWSHNGDVMIFM